MLRLFVKTPDRLPNQVDGTILFYNEKNEKENTNVRISITDSHALQHLRVARIRSGEPIELLDGKGTVALVEFISLEKKKAIFQMLHLEVKSRPSVNVLLACALLQGKAFEKVVCHAAQMGVTVIQPLITERVQKGKHARVTLDRLQTVAQEACKQSGNPYLPIIAEPIRLDEWLSMSSESKDVMRLVASLESNAIPIRDAFIHEAKSLHLLIGPEGDFSEQEHARIRELSWTAVRLAPYILRTEVAALVMLAQCV